MLCITIAIADSRWTTVLDGKVVGTSKHIDYSLFHHKAKDVAALKKPISKFVFVNEHDAVTESISAPQLGDRGCNYKTAKRDETGLSDDEQAIVKAAVNLVREQPTQSTKVGKPAQAASTSSEPPKAVVTDAGAANGLGAFVASAEAAQTGPTAQAPDAAANDEAEGTADEPGDDEPPADPTSNVKPSRKKRRR